VGGGRERCQGVCEDDGVRAGGLRRGGVNEGGRWARWNRCHGPVQERGSGSSPGLWHFSTTPGGLLSNLKVFSCMFHFGCICSNMYSPQRAGQRAPKNDNKNEKY